MNAGTFSGMAPSQQSSSTVPLGSYALFSANAPSVVNTSDGSTFLKSGVIAPASTYPQVPKDLQSNLNPLVPVGQIGSGGMWVGMTMDPNTGLPLIVSDTGGGYLIMVRSLSSDRRDDIICSTTSITSGLGAYTGMRYGKLISHKGRVAVAGDPSLSAYSMGVWNSFNSGVFGNASFNNTLIGAGSSNKIVCFASNPNGNVVGISQNGSTVWYASDLSSAASVGSIASATWTGVTYNATAGVFIAVASGGTQAASSADGVTWTNRTLPASASWSAVAAGNGARSVAVASGGTQAAYSDNGTTWTSATLPVSASWSAVAHNGIQWVAIARNSNIAASSSDGINWTQRTLPVTAGWSDVQWCATLGAWIAISDDGRAGAAYSLDGITWTAKTLPFTVNFTRYVSAGGNTFYAIDYTSAGAFTIAKTTDAGLTWTYYKPNIKIGHSSSGPETQLKFINGALTLAWMQSQVNVARSTDGITWSLTSASMPYSASLMTDIEWNGSTYAMTFLAEGGTGDHNYIWTSPDLLTWTARLLTGSSLCKWGQIITVGTTFVALGCVDGSSAQISRSTTGLSWTASSFGVNGGTWQYCSLKYNSVNNIIALNVGYSSSGYVSFNGGANWELASPLTSPAQLIGSIFAGGGNTWGAHGTNVMYVYGTQYGSLSSSSSYISYSSGYTIIVNNSPFLTGIVNNVVVNGISYYIGVSNAAVTGSPQLFLRSDPSLYINNTRQASENAGGLSNSASLNYYMRVK